MPVAQKIRCRVDRLIDHGDHVYTVDLVPERRAPQFRPGQFLHLALDEYDPSGFWPDSRVFSIASSPSQRERLRISYSVQGRFTARMEQELREGQRVWVKLPYGEFFISDLCDVVLFAGGTGITPFTAFLEGLTPENRRNIYLVYGARTSRLLIYRELVEERAKTIPLLHPFYFVERDIDKPGSIAGETKSGETIGRLSVTAVWDKIKSPFETLYYVSGSPSMLKAISQDLSSRGISSGSIKIDAWE
jgi:ferredoxin-NADP reductase